ncbi:hypothetical protein [Streptomyces vastus]|uniref:hypothetical protein n=1 Tax=Streptomyces vastus TaxID=285451 RepID=UPI0031E42A72
MLAREGARGLTFRAVDAEAGLPGGDEIVTVLYLAMLGLIVEHLTLPGVLEGVLPGVSVPDGLVERIVPASDAGSEQP